MDCVKVHTGSRAFAALGLKQERMLLAIERKRRTHTVVMKEVIFLEVWVVCWMSGAHLHIPEVSRAIVTEGRGLALEIAGKDHENARASR